MSGTNWMLYGATGATGVLIAEEAIRRGQRPILAGRNAETLAPLAEGLGLPWVAVSLDDKVRLEQAVSEVGAVLNAAGPFGATVQPLVQACLASGTHYLDIAGEIAAQQEVFSQERAAQKRNIALIAGVGFGVTAGNSIAAYVAAQVPHANTLELAVKASNRQESAGAAKSVLGAIAGGGFVYRDGQLVPLRLGKGLKKLQFPDGEFDILPVPSADLEAAFRATRVANITAFGPFKPAAAFLLPLVQWAVSRKPIRRRLEATIDKKRTQKVDEKARPHVSYAWARASNKDGQQAEAWLELGEGYGFTAASSVRAIERVQQGGLSGALTPAQAFGADFVLDIKGVRRWSKSPLVTGKSKGESTV